VQRSRTGKWYVCFSCECAEPAPLPPAGCEVGLDVGLKVFAMPTHGAPIENPRFFRQDERALAGAQRRFSREAKGTPARAQRRRIVARVHERIAWRRRDFAHQHSRRIVNQFDLIAVEDLSVNRMVHTHCLAKSIHDAAWTQFAALLSYKAAWAGRRYVAVNPAYTSQDCSGCGHRQALILADRTYSCPCCGLVLDRDLNAARNILARAKAQLGLGQQSLAQAEKPPACAVGSCHRPLYRPGERGVNVLRADGQGL
jgi:putative transposase